MCLVTFPDVWGPVYIPSMPLNSDELMNISKLILQVPRRQIYNTRYTTVRLTHWGRVTLICVSKLTIIASDNGLSPDRRQAIIWTNAGILLIGPLGTNVSEILSESHTFSFKKMHLKTSSAKWRPFCLVLKVLNGDFGTRSRHLGHVWVITPRRKL